MLIVYDSLTGNVKRFVDKLNMINIKIHNGLIVDEPFVLVTYTIGFGNVPKSTMEFLSNNSSYLKGVASSGNRNWGSNFGRSADIISQTFNTPLIMKFELAGTSRDIDIFKQEVIAIENRKYS